jgi:HEAT repeat protein
MVALIFAERRGRWLTQTDVIDSVNKKFSDSTVRKAFKILSCPLDVLGGYSFIDIESVKKDGKGRPLIRGILSQAALEKIFTLVTPVKQEPVSYFPEVNMKGRLEIPPLQIGDKYLPPEDIMRLLIQKCGKMETRRLLRKMVNDIPGAEKEAMRKLIVTLAEKQGVIFNATKDQFYKGNQVVVPSGKPAEVHAMWRRLPGEKDPYARAVDIADIIKKHHFGPFPGQQYIITDRGLMELASDENRTVYSMTAHIGDSQADDARVLALEERAKKGEQVAFEELIQVLSNDTSKYARQEAARSLGHLNDIRAIESLTNAMLSDEYNATRHLAADALAAFGYRQEFAMALKDRDHYVRQEVASILGRIGDSQAVEPLIEVLKDADIGVQCAVAVAIALGKIGDTRAIDSLITLLDYENESVKLLPSQLLKTSEILGLYLV